MLIREMPSLVTTPIIFANASRLIKRLTLDTCHFHFNAKYLGETTNIKPYIEKACCVVLPSYREGTSRVLLEAASVGRPIIASNVPGCKDIVIEGKNGFFCDLL